MSRNNLSMLLSLCLLGNLPLMFFCSVLLIQPTYTLPKGEENLLIPVHAYPVIDDLRIPPHINLPAVPLGQRCVCVCVVVQYLLWTFSWPPTCLRAFLSLCILPVQPTMLPFTRLCQIITKKISHLCFFLSPVWATLFLWDAAAPLILRFRCMLFSPMRPSPSIL